MLPTHSLGSFAPCVAPRRRALALVDIRAYGHDSECDGILTSDTARMAANDFSEFEVVPDDRSEVQKLGDESAVDGAVDIPTLKCCFPKVFEVFKDREDWVILGALEAAGMDEAKAIRNLKAKIRQAKQLGLDLKVRRWQRHRACPTVLCHSPTRRSADAHTWTGVAQAAEKNEQRQFVDKRHAAVSNEVQTMVKQEERDERSRLQRLTEGQRSVELAKDEVA